MRNGYTLLELLLVIAIVAIVGVSSSAYTTRFYSQNAVATTTDQLVSALRKAQFYSMMSKQNGVWGVRYTTSPDKRITLFLHGNNGFDENFQVKDSVIISGFTQITFTHAVGLPSSTATAASPITITGNAESESLSINSQGVVSKN